MRDKFVTIGHVSLRWDNVVAVAVGDERPLTTDIILAGGAQFRVEMKPDEVFKKLDASQKHYGLEREILDLACRLERELVDFEGTPLNHTSRRESLSEDIVGVRRSLSRVVREYMGMGVTP